MAMNKAQLEKSRELWVKREREYKAKAATAHAKHKLREKQLAALVPKAAVVMPMKHITEDSWGYHPPGHDGIDLICPPSEPLIAMCKAKVVRADASGWWGKGAPTDPVLKAKGDGIIIIRSLVDAGPLREGMNLCYGHAEGATVKAGQTVNPGDVIGRAGFANAWHVHFMVNDNPDTRGVGDRDPKPILDYAKKGPA
jgi:murein DD-endopeptidase MepM/ murein hydrolase activator NlpD